MSVVSPSSWLLLLLEEATRFQGHNGKSYIYCVFLVKHSNYTEFFKIPGNLSLIHFKMLLKYLPCYKNEI